MFTNGALLLKKLIKRAGIALLISSLTAVGVTAASEKTDLSQQIRAAHKAGKLDGLHSVAIYQKGKLIAEAYFEGEDQSWGSSLGMVQHGPDTLHDLRSVTKSVVGLLYGIALQDGLVPGPDEKLLDQFPDYADLKGEADRDAIRIQDVLTMRMGTDWNENLPYTDIRNSEIAMERAKDRYRFVLSRKMVEKPGTAWRYSGGATALLGRLIAKGTGKSLDAYANEKLFKPLEITKFEWARGSDGEPSAASGLRLTVHDLAKIGMMMMDQGRYKGQQIVSAEWIKEILSPKADLKSGLRYGYHWYLAPGDNPPRWVSGFGNGGQRLTLQLQAGVALALFAGNYNQRDGWKMPVRLIEEVLVPALERR